jgi:ATP-dependent RNA helicase RhlE
VLIATDIASRGIDVVGIELVINYDLPENSEDYVHRIGRTARAGEKGHAILFATQTQRGEVRDIERLVRQNIPVSRTLNLPPIPKTVIQAEGARVRKEQHAPSGGRMPHRPFRRFQRRGR